MESVRFRKTNSEAYEVVKAAVDRDSMGKGSELMGEVGKRADGMGEYDIVKAAVERTRAQN
jgi:hypothetical protein